MEYALVSRPDDDRTLELDHRVFSYAGKFVRSATGKAVAREGGAIVAAASFSPDRSDPDVARIRIVTVHEDRQGESIGARLLAGLRATLLADRYDRVAIAVNNPYAYQAAYRAGFGYTGERTGMAELVLAAPCEAAAERYADGLAVYAERDDLPAEMRAYVAERRGSDPPSTVEPPSL